jgi:TatD DNase family protein
MIDSHCHLADDAFAADLEDTVRRARDAGVSSAVCVLDAGSAVERLRANTVRALWPGIRFAVGVHPHQAGAYADDPAAAVAAVAQALGEIDDVCAVGEMGLDYHYDFAPRAVQQQVFAAQVRFARERLLPIVIHTREADGDTVRILEEAGEGQVRGVFHCFTGDAALAAAALRLGFHISFSGIVTFNNARALRDVAASVPDDRLLIETDSPFLAPVPYRSRRNEPAFVGRIAETLAVVRGSTREAIVDRTTANVGALFGRA